MIRDFISLIFPQNCINCSQSLISQEHFLCTRCKIDLPLTQDSRHFDNRLFQKFAFERKVQSAQAFLYFNKGGITQKLLHHLKYNGKKELGVKLGEWFAPELSHLSIDMIIPVPLHKSKQKRRGYNQSECIADGLSKVLNLPIEKSIEREVFTETQTKKSKVKRWSNMENVYSIPQIDLSDLSVLVVDDVITTGATVGMLCDRLIEANVRDIHIAAIARGK